MFINATSFFSYIDYRRFVSITGYKGAGKDLMTAELVSYYLARKSRKYDVPYQLISNQDCVWNDPIRGEDGNFLDARASVFWITEAGMYLRHLSDFRSPYALARKLDCYFLFPSLELSHELLQSFTVEPIGNLQNALGLSFNPLWYWRVSGQIRGRSQGGLFCWVPNKDFLGVYDTDDLSDSTFEIMEFFNATVERLQREKGREYKVADISRGDDNSIASVYSSLAASLEAIAEYTDTRKRSILEKILGV